jgi:hypothetical protein
MRAHASHRLILSFNVARRPEPFVGTCLHDILQLASQFGKPVLLSLLSSLTRIHRANKSPHRGTTPRLDSVSLSHITGFISTMVPSGTARLTVLLSTAFKSTRLYLSA